MPRPVTDEVGQGAALSLIDWLSVRAKNKDQIEFLDFVSDLLSEYEIRFEKPQKPADPVEVLRYLVEENGITTRELGMAVRPGEGGCGRRQVGNSPEVID